MDREEFSTKQLLMMKFISQFLEDSIDKIWVMTDEEQIGKANTLINNYVSKADTKVVHVDFSSKRRI